MSIDRGLRLTLGKEIACKPWAGDGIALFMASFYPTLLNSILRVYYE